MRYFITEEDFATAEKNGISRKNVTQRVDLYNMDVDKAITKPVKKKNTYDPKMLELAEKNGLLHIFRPRVNSGNFTEYQAATEPLNTASQAGKKGRKNVRKFTDEHLRIMKENGISPGTARQRISVYNMSLEVAITRPLSRRGNQKNIGGKQS